MSGEKCPDPMPSIRYSFLCLRQGRLAGGGIMFSGCPSVRLSVRPFVRAFVTRVVNMIF